MSRHQWPGKKRQIEAVEFAMRELADSHPKIIERLCSNRLLDWHDEETRVRRRAALVDAADALLGVNPTVSYCLYASAIGLWPGDKKAKTRSIVESKARVAIRRAQQLRNQAANQRKRVAQQRAQARAAQKRNAAEHVVEGSALAVRRIAPGDGPPAPAASQSRTP